MTGSKSTSRTGEKHPYYKCKTKGCALGNKSIKRDEIETAFVGVLKKIKPTKKALNITRGVFEDIWSKKQAEWANMRNDLSKQLQALSTKKERLIDLVTRTNSDDMVRAYEEKIADIHENELVLKESIMSYTEHKEDIGTTLDIVFDFLENPLKQWGSPDINRKRLVLKLVFQEQLAYNKKSGFETAILSLPLRVFTLPEEQNACLVDPTGIEPATS